MSELPTQKISAQVRKLPLPSGRPAGRQASRRPRCRRYVTHLINCPKTRMLLWADKLVQSCKLPSRSGHKSLTIRLSLEQKNLVTFQIKTGTRFFFAHSILLQNPKLLVPVPESNYRLYQNKRDKEREGENLVSCCIEITYHQNPESWKLNHFFETKIIHLPI